MNAQVIVHKDKVDEFKRVVLKKLLAKQIIAKYKYVSDDIFQIHLNSTTKNIIRNICNYDCVKSLKIFKPGIYSVPAPTNELDTITSKLDVRSSNYYQHWRGVLNSYYGTNSTIAGGTTYLVNIPNESQSYATEPPFTVPWQHVVPPYDKLLTTQPNPQLNIPSYISSYIDNPENTPVAFLSDDAPPNPWPATIFGCTDEAFVNYNPEATINDGTCTNDIYGCTDPLTSNFNPDATIDNGTCIPFIPGCVDQTADNYNPAAEVSDGSCIFPPVPGCTNPQYEEFSILATVDNGTCQTPRELITQVIPIEPGWNMISSFINMSEPPYSNYTVEEFFINHLHIGQDNYQTPDALIYDPDMLPIIKDARGFFYSFSTGAGTLQQINFNNEGYLLYSDYPTTKYLIFRGNPVTSTIVNQDTTLTIPHTVTSVNLDSHWNIMPVLTYSNVSVQEWIAFNDELNTGFSEYVITLIKDAQGSFYDVASGVGGLEYLVPHKAYLVYIKPESIPNKRVARFTIPVVYGCTDQSAFNYQSFAKIENGSCYYSDEIAVHEITLPGRDDMGWAPIAPFSNYMISTYIDLDLLENNDVQYIFENYLYDENGVKVPVDNIYKYIYSVKDIDGRIFFPDQGITGDTYVGTEYNPTNGIGDWNTGETLVVVTAAGQNEAFSLRIEGTPVRDFSKEIRGDVFTGTFNALPVLATASVDVVEYFNTSIGANADNILQIKDNATGASYNWAEQVGFTYNLIPGKSYIITLQSNDSVVTLNRDIEPAPGTNVVTQDEASTFIPQSIILPPEQETFVSSYINLRNPVTQAPYSVHEIVYNNISLTQNTPIPASIATISSSIEYVALPSYSESFSVWQTSSFASPNLDLKWDHHNGNGYIIKNRATVPLYFNFYGPLIQTSSTANDGNTVSHTDHASSNVTQSLIGAYCVENTTINDYFSTGTLTWLEHISSSNNQFWTASGPEHPGTLEYIEPGSAYKITTHQSHPDYNPLQLTFGNIPTVINNPDLTAQTLTSDDININVAELDLNNSATNHVINLIQGWNMISTYIDITQFTAASQSLDVAAGGILANNLYYEDGLGNNIKVNLASLDNYVRIMKDNQGRAILPEFSFNGIGYWDPTQGYQIKVFQPMKIIFEGQELADKTWVLQEGWNIINWPYAASNNVLAAIPEEYIQYIIIIKNNTAQVFWPEFGFNGIGDFIPGQGYQIKVTQDITIPLLGSS